MSCCGWHGLRRLRIRIGRVRRSRGGGQSLRRLIRGCWRGRGQRRSRWVARLHSFCRRRAGGSGVGVVGAARPENDSENDDEGGDGDDSPRNFGGAVAEIFAARANVFGAGKLQFGEFFDLCRGLCFHGRKFGLDGASPFGHRGARLRRGSARACGFPDFVGVDLRLAEAGEVVGDGFFVVESEMLGVGADESLVEDAAREQVEVLFFDGLEHARADLGDVGDVIVRELFLLACLAEFVAEFAHVGLPRMTETS